MFIRQMFISPGHSYFGRHGLGAADFPVIEQERIECIAGRGIRGDRFFDYRTNYRGQITFFSEEVFRRLSAAFPAAAKPATALRRNVIVSGVDLNQLIGREFTLQNVGFRGMAECRPCYWMNDAFYPGTEAWLKGNGGLRAQILTGGFLEVGDGELTLIGQGELALAS